MKFSEFQLLALSLQNCLYGSWNYLPHFLQIFDHSMTHDSSLSFSWSNAYFGQNNDVKYHIFRLWITHVKFSISPILVFETTQVSFTSNFYITFWYQDTWLLCRFYAEPIYTLGKRSTSAKKFQRSYMSWH